MDSETAGQVAQGQIRTVIALIAGAFVAHGWINGGTSTEIIGILGSIVPLAWSAWGHIQAGHKAKKRDALAVNVGFVVADATVGPTPLASPEKAAALIKAVAPSIPAVIPAALSPMEANP
jgi:hypothetical protein